MCHEDHTAGSGRRTGFTPYETRRIVIAEGLDFHESDTDHRRQVREQYVRELRTNPSAFRRTDTKFHQRVWNYVDRIGWIRRGWSDQRIANRLIRILDTPGEYSAFRYLELKLGSDFRVEGNRKNAEYVNSHQRVRYQLQVVDRKTEFKTALETDGIIVIYGGHSRYGRGACFDQYTDTVNEHGEQWESGTTNDNGLYRLGYPYFAVPLEDIEHHQYTFIPLAEGDEILPRRRRHPFNRHPRARRRWRLFTLPEELRRYVHPTYRSLDDRYYGLRRQRKQLIILVAGWTDTGAAPYDLGATTLRCRTFCHFGCSSRLHFWHIIRRSEYKGWQRNRPPTDKFAYFTTEAATFKATCYWLYYLLAYQDPNNSSHWWDSHEYAKRRANRQLRREREGFLIY